MKYILLAILAVLCISTYAVADDDVKYEVKINVVFNAVSPERAAELIRDAQVRYKDACKTELASKKVSSNSDVLTVGDATWYVTSEGDIVANSSDEGFASADAAWNICPGSIRKDDGRWYCVR